MNPTHPTHANTAQGPAWARSVARIAVLVAAVLGVTLLRAPLAGAQAPDNDAVTDVAVIDPSALPFTASVDTTSAGSDGDDATLGCPAPATDASVWYSITPATDMLLVVDGVGSDYSWGISAATGGPGGWELLECRPFAFLVEAEANVTYWFQVFDDRSDGGENGGNLEFTVRESTAAADGAPSLPDDELVIETELSFNEDGSATGTFAVLAGSDVMGCSSGTFEDGDVEELHEGLEITKVLSCDAGPRTGTLSVRFQPGAEVNEPDRQTGPWEVVGGTGDFTGVSGSGDHEVVFDSSSTGVETLAGTIRFAAAQDELAVTGAETTWAAVAGAIAIGAGLVLLAVRFGLVRRRATGS